MIIFDLDGTLADCEHRRHFVDPKKCHYCKVCGQWLLGDLLDCISCDSCGKSPKNFQPDWKSFYQACDQDKPIIATIKTFTRLEEYSHDIPIQIWSGRCESVREKTVKWLEKSGSYDELACVELKMRPIGDNTSDDQIKQRWLDETLAEGKKIDFVFDSHPESIRMWRRRGIFVFNCSQHDQEF